MIIICKHTYKLDKYDPCSLKPQYLSDRTASSEKASFAFKFSVSVYHERRMSGHSVRRSKQSTRLRPPPPITEPPPHPHIGHIHGRTCGSLMDEAVSNRAMKQLFLRSISVRTLFKEFTVRKEKGP